MGQVQSANDNNPFARVGGYTGGSKQYSWSTGTPVDYRGASYVDQSPVSRNPTFTDSYVRNSRNKIVAKQDAILGVTTLNAMPESQAWWAAIAGYDQPLGAYGENVTLGVPSEDYSIQTNLHDDAPGQSVVLNVIAPKVGKSTYNNWRNGRNPANGS